MTRRVSTVTRRQTDDIIREALDNHITDIIEQEEE